ncbi:chorismate-binding protein [Crocinitomicaceae bacterium]|nr:chorismate-binding protein [Crocinitomicaceae bacterium]
MNEIPDIVFYRIPGENVVSKMGALQLVEKGETPSGFTVSNFKGDQVYQLIEGKQSEFTGLPKIESTTKEDYLKAAKNIVEYLKIHQGKAVLSRLKEVQGPEDVKEYFNALCEAYPNAFVYTLIGAKIGMWVGATPETLIKEEKNVARTMALAGTRKSKGDSAWEEKEFEEHELVADFIASNLKTSNISDIKRSQRYDTNSGPVKHLRTDFEFAIAENQVWELAQKLHPTPAVSGWPVDKAISLIESNEGHDRSIYTGIIGVIEESTHLFVNLRCAQIVKNKMYLYVGGGFTKDSDPEAEWEETENKAATLINVLKNG